MVESGGGGGGGCCCCDGFGSGGGGCCWNNEVEVIVEKDFVIGIGGCGGGIEGS